MDKLKKVLSGQDMEDRDSLSNVVEATSLSSGTRIKGFITCFAARILCPRWELLYLPPAWHPSPLPLTVQTRICLGVWEQVIVPF
uniref:Uncharacterized protein n=1 Tax=Sus scrofa TaxID=9823 RepID=A0A8D1J979_PIG